MNNEEFIEYALKKHEELLSLIPPEPNAGRHGYLCTCILCRRDRNKDEAFQNWLLGRRDVEIFKANIVGLQMMLKENASQEEIEEKKKIIRRWLDL
ncbi:MAG: hypothetical protein M0R48_09915 [Candidatus Omnitrophica bacterium]|nr:hypothetical protein [Candidatus Omnitrophota bacterium]